MSVKPLIKTLKNTDLNKGRVVEINNRIAMEYCSATEQSLSYDNMFDCYKMLPSVKTKIRKLERILIQHNVEHEKTQHIIKDCMKDFIIPPGSKGNACGNKFNQIIKDHILTLGLSRDRFDIAFEEKHKKHIIDEIPDWYIYDKHDDKILIGMNQLSLWGGGAQSNRGGKYLNEKNNTEKFKLLCVVCNKTKIKKSSNRTYKIFDIGFKNNTLCYKGGIKKIVEQYFGLTDQSTDQSTEK